MTAPVTIVRVERLFAAGAHADLPAHLARFGALPARPDLVAELDRAGLRGRGGAAFPLGAKLRAASPGAVVIGNGHEGEPASRKDSTLLTHAPHLVVDGLVAVADAIGASRIALVVPAGMEARIRAAFVGRTDVDRVEVRAGGDGFVAGEASAIALTAEGRRPLPLDRRVRLAVRGPAGRSTVVSNVETLAQAALIARFGAEWFRTAGTPDDPGTRLVTISDGGLGSQVHEVAGGAPLADVLRLGGHDPHRVRAVLVGGYHGTWIGPDRFDEPLTARGALPAGAGVLIPLAGDRCGLRAAADLAEYLAGESAGQCGPCRFGLPSIAAVLADVAAGRPGAVAEARRLAGLVEGRGACHHPDGTVRMVGSALEEFALDARAHAAGRCEAQGSPVGEVRR